MFFFINSLSVLTGAPFISESILLSLKGKKEPVCGNIIARKVWVPKSFLLFW